MGRDKELLQGILDYFKINNNLSKINLKIFNNTVSLTFAKQSDIFNIIIPFFEKYPIIGYKKLDFEDFSDNKKK